MFTSKFKISKVVMATLTVLFSAVSNSQASELDLVIPSLTKATYSIFGLDFTGNSLLLWGMAVCLLGMAFG